MQELLAYLAATPQQVVIPAAVSFFSTVIGVAVVVFQLRRQARNAIAQTRKNEELKRKVEIFERLTDSIREAQDKIAAHTGYMRNFVDHLKILGFIKEASGTVSAPSVTVQEYQRLSSDALQAVSKVTRKINNWQIIEPKLDVFQDCFGMVLDEIHRMPGRADSLVIYETMPLEERAAEWRLPSPDAQERLARRINQESREFDRLSCWLGDLQVELQLLLLGELFEKEVPRRDPPDPDFFCIRLDKYSEIKERLDGSTWGAEVIEREAEAWDRFSRPERDAPAQN